MMSAIELIEFVWRHRDVFEPIVRAIKEAIEVGRTDAQIRRRIADGVKTGDLLSDRGLHAMRIASQSVNEYLGRS